MTFCGQTIKSQNADETKSEYQSKNDAMNLPISNLLITRINGYAMILVTILT